MKKWIALMLAAMLLLTLAACGGTTETPAAAESAETAVAGETYDAGQVSALVPGGWKAFPQHDVFSDDPNAMLPDVINICKGGESDMDLFSKPYIRFDFGGANKTLYMADKDFYDDVKDLDPITTGSHTWNGFSCDNYGSKLTVLFCEEGAIQYQASIFTETSGGKISLEDADVLAILASVAPTGEEDLAAASAAPAAQEPSAAEPAADDPSALYARYRGDWHGMVGFRDCTGKYDDMDGSDTNAIARFKVFDGGVVNPFVGVHVEDTPIENLTAAWDEENGALLLSGTWISVDFSDVPAVEENGTLHFEIPIAKEAGSLRLVFNLRRLDDTGWTDEDPRMTDEDAAHCVGMTFDELAELNGYAFTDYPGRDEG